MLETKKATASTLGNKTHSEVALQLGEEAEALPNAIKRNAKGGGYKVGGFSFASLEQAMAYAVSNDLVETTTASFSLSSIPQTSFLEPVIMKDLPSCITRNARGAYKVGGFSFASLEQAMAHAVSNGLIDETSTETPSIDSVLQSTSFDPIEVKDLPSCIKRNAKGGYKVGGFSFASLEQAMAHAVRNGLVEISLPLSQPLPLDQSATEDKADSRYSAEEASSPESTAEYAGLNESPIFADGISQPDPLNQTEETPPFLSKKILTDQCKIWVQADGWVTADKILNHINPSFSKKTTQFDFVKAVDILADIGFGVVPDPRYGLQIPKEHEVVFLFELEELVGHQNPSELCKKYLIELALGAFISQADGIVSDRERNILVNRIAAADISEAEQKYLKINLDWLLAVPVDSKVLRRRLKKIDKGEQDTLRSLMISVALADGHPSTKEIAAIEDIYPLIGLDMSVVYSDLHAGGVTDTLVLVQKAEPPAPSERIPEEKSNRQPDYALALNRERIAEIESDSKTSSVLLNISLAEESTENLDTFPIVEESPLPGLIKKYAYFVRDIIEKEYWSEEEFNALAKKHNLMASGVFEAVNEWSFENYEDVLLDEYNGYDVAAELSETLKIEFKKKGL